MPESRRLNKEIIYIKVEEAYAVWFIASRKFLMIEEPAFYILKKIIGKYSSNEIIKYFSSRYRLPIYQVEVFFEEINRSFSKFLVSYDFQESLTNNLNKYQLSFFNKYSEKTYAIGNKTLKIVYGNQLLENVIHPLLFHFEKKKQVKSSHLLEIFKNNSKIILRVDYIPREIFNSNEIGFLKASVLLKVLSFIHNIEDNKWMMTVHASAVSQGNTAIVFPASAGNGKTTLAVLLQAHGFQLLTDDFVAMDRDKYIYNLPVATTIKDGSIDILTPYYPEINSISSELAYTGKKVRYFPVVKTFKSGTGYKTNNFVFINYSAELPFSFEKISKKVAMQMLLKETWINPEPTNVMNFFNWFDTIQFYQLIYSKISDVLDVIEAIN